MSFRGNLLRAYPPEKLNSLGVVQYLLWTSNFRGILKQYCSLSSGIGALFVPLSYCSYGQSCEMFNEVLVDSSLVGRKKNSPETYQASTREMAGLKVTREGKITHQAGFYQVCYVRVSQVFPNPPYKSVVAEWNFFMVVSWIHLIPKWRKIHYSLVSSLLPRFKPNIPLNSADGIEATRAN